MAAPLPNLTLHEGTDREAVNPVQIVDGWFASLNQAFEQNSIQQTGEPFIEDCWWRDILAFSWDWTTKGGKVDVLDYIGSSDHGFGKMRSIRTGSLQPMLMDMAGMQWIQSGFEFENSSGTGRGLLRLANVGPNVWKAWIVFTRLEALKDAPETDGTGADKSETDYQVFVVGAGHSGLMLGAHLQARGLKYVLVDSNAQLGDSWQNRYSSVTLHTPKYMDRFPFVPFPEDYPTFATQSDVVSFQKQYAKELGLNVKLETRVTLVSYDDKTRMYTIEAQTPTGKQTFTSRHIVLATGIFSNKPVRPSFPNENSFRGQVYHSGAHKSASLIENVKDKRVVIVGAGTSAHDVAQDFVEHGAKEVSMVQRHPIFTTSRESIVSVQAGMWNTEGVSTDEADLMATSFPLPLLRTMAIGQTKAITTMDKKMLDGMENQGMGLRRGDDGVSMVEYQLLRIGHFYIDQGACQMIIDGRIKILPDEGGVEDFYADGVALADGRKVPADVVVLATGFNRMPVDVQKIMGQAVRDKVGDIGRLDNEQERIGWWRPTGFPGFWFMTGNFIWGRMFSPVLALQIEAIEKGFNESHYTAPDIHDRINRE